MKPRYIASFSDLMRIALKNDTIATNNAQKLAEQALDIILSTEGVADSLKKESISGISKSIRQVDMKNDDNEVMLKTFTGWNDKENCWHILLEFSFETFWENRNKPIGKG